MGRCTKVEHERRILEFTKRISAGWVRSSLCQYAADEWGLSVRQADRLIAQARETVIADIDQDRQQVTAELIHTMKTVIQGSLEQKQYNNAIGAASLLAKLGHLIE